MGHKPFDDILLKVRRGTWRETTLRLIRAEQELDRAKGYMVDMVQAGTNAGRKQGQEDVLRLIARWGVCRPLEGYNGEQMAEALRKVITPTIAPYTDYKGITQAMTEESDPYADEQPGDLCCQRAVGGACFKHRQNKELYR